METTVLPRPCGAHVSTPAYIMAAHAGYQLGSEVWESWMDRNATETHHQNPQFFDHLNRYGNHKTSIIMAADAQGVIIGICPVLEYQCRLRFMAFHRNWFTVKLHSLYLLGSAPLGNLEAYDNIFTQLLDLNTDAVVLSSVPVEGALWDYLRRSALIESRSLLYVAHTGPCYVLTLPSSCAEYAKQLGRHHRRALSRHVRLLSQLGELKLQLINTSDHVAELRAAMVALDATNSTSVKYADCSRLHGYGGVACSTDAELASLADHGLLHCYILYCGSLPMALLLGSRYKSTCYTHSIHRAQLDPKLAPGTVIMDWAIEDSISRGITCIDHGYGSGRRDFSNRCTVQTRATILLLRQTWAKRCSA